jgi:dTDP-4-dehydrorhamnose 3,5-epimerase
MPAPHAQSLRIPEVLLLKPKVFRDNRGYFFESHNAQTWAEAGIDVSFVQDNTSLSERGTLRGLHAQIRKPQAKLVRVLDGIIFDVAVDIRRGSPSFGQWVGATLTAEGFEQLFIPAGFAHGFCVISETARIAYKVSDFYDPGGEISLAWNDPALNISWPTEEPLLSPKDANAPVLSAIASLPKWVGP